MPNFPKHINLHEEGPREGFQIEKNTIPTHRKIELIDALSKTGLRHIQIVSFVNPSAVPGMADADDIVAGIASEPGVAYTGLWLNAKGYQRALATKRLTITGTIVLYASDAFVLRNQKRSAAEHLTDQLALLKLYDDNRTPVTAGIIAAAFGCNFQGDIPANHVLGLARQIMDIAHERGDPITSLMLNDTMGWATPRKVKEIVGPIQDAYPELGITLHLHDTRGMAIANAYAGLEMGISSFDSAVAGLGGCPFAGSKGAAGNISSEELVLLCEELGIETGIDLDKLIECARLAEDIVGRTLPSAVIRGGSLKALRAKIAGTA